MQQVMTRAARANRIEIEPAPLADVESRWQRQEQSGRSVVVIT
jgi:hypothetical protein